jgi:serine/threonine protein kinase
MSLNAGDKIGPYEIIEKAGAGGMGEVYKASDSRLERTVAIKVLPATFALNQDIKQRFEREAKAISSLNHPNICTLYDIGEQNGTDYLVMEYIEGETLAEKLTKGPIEIDELIKIAIQITDALDKAHKQGLVHRDLKPGNVMLSREGAKLLDFGLAKLQPETGIAGKEGVTATTPLTMEGTIVGTMQYMSPEQLEGKEADSRSDIFSFGILLYEMSTGVKAFKGGSQASLIASIMKEKPRSASEIQPLVPPMLEQVINQCLEKDPEQRWQTAGDLKRSLMWVSEGGSQVGLPAVVSRKRKSREKSAWAIAILLLLTTIGLSYMVWQYMSETKQVTKSHIIAPENTEFSTFAGGSFTLSPDGQKLAFIAEDTTNNKTLLWVRPLNSLAALPLPGTEDAYLPFWSPDSRYVAFFQDGKLKKILATGGPTLSICDAQSGRNGDWNKDDIISFTPTFTDVIHKVSAAGGEAVPITTLDSTKGDVTHRYVRFLPDGNHFIFYARTGTGSVGDEDAICLGALDKEGFDRIIPAASTVDYADGHILYQREASLMAHPFDAGALELTGDAFPIAEKVSYVRNWSRSVFTVSDNGILVYRSGDINIGSQLFIRNREGQVIDSIGELEIQFTQSYSPDEGRIAVDIEDGSNSNNDIWIYDLNRKIKTRFTFDGADEFGPIWSPDGNKIAFRSDRVQGKKGLYVKNSSGVGELELLYETDKIFWPDDWHPDGSLILIETYEKETNGDIYAVPLNNDEPYPVINSSFEEYEGIFSPDGRWIAYVSDETGTEQIYVTPFPGPGSKWQISIADGDRPQWSKTGKEIFFLDNEDQIMVAEVDGSDDSFRVGNVKPLFKVAASRPGSVFDITGDGQKFISNEAPITTSDSKVVIVKNWNLELEK